MPHEESKLQQQCVAWFRAQYPQYAMLLTHVANEGNGSRVTGAIHKAEGTVAGVPDLLLFMPSAGYHGLGIEMKTAKGRQSESQKGFQRMFEAAGYKYAIARSLDAFRDIINDYVEFAYYDVRREIAGAHVELERESMERARKRLKIIVNTDKH